jgi:hypothetical protein
LPASFDSKGWRALFLARGRLLWQFYRKQTIYLGTHLKMIKAATMFTYELDDPEKALRELREQLDAQMGLLKNTVGVLACDPEFIKTGVVKTVLEKFPFPIVGATSMAQSANGETGKLLLTLMALTSDDVFFATGMSKAASKEDFLSDVGPSCREAQGRLGADLRLILLFMPYDSEMPGNFYVDVYSALCPGVPIFGSIATDDFPKFSEGLSIGGGHGSKDEVAFILVGGNVAPRFFSAVISGDRMLAGGTITKSQGNLLMEIDGVPAYEYFAEAGFAKGGDLHHLRFLPLVMDPQKSEGCGAPPIHNEVSGFDQNGFAVCHMDLSQNSTFKLGIVESKEIIESSKAMIEKVNAEQGAQALIMFSCIGRRISLLAEPLKEMNLVSEIIDKNTPYVIAYSGGEICPVSSPGEPVANRFYIYALIACLL